MRISDLACFRRHHVFDLPKTPGGMRHHPGGSPSHIKKTMHFYSKILRKLKSDFFRLGSFAACCIIIFLVPYLFLVEIAMHVGVRKSNFEFFVVLLVWVIIILVYALYLRSKGAFKIHK